MSDTNTSEEKRSKVAERHYIAADGALTKNEEDAVGVRYKHVGTGEVIELKTGLEAGSIGAMLAAFGAKTWIGNLVSQFTDRENGGVVDFEGVRERLADLSDGNWPGREAGEGAGPGARMDRDALAEAIVLVLEDAGDERVQGDKRAGVKAAVRQKIEDDLKWAMGKRRVTEVAVHYLQLTGKTTSPKDVLAGL